MAAVHSVRRTVRAMNGDVDFFCYAQRPGRRLDRAAAWLRGFERRFSRFDPGSELSRLNAAAGRPTRVSPQLLRLVSESLALARRSGGLFDPTVLLKLEAAGYDRSFEHVSGDEARLKACAGPGACSWRDVRLDPDARTVTLAPETAIDLGGMAKGWAVDRMAAIIGSPGLVNAGGDLMATGRPHDAEAWMVGVEDPFHPERDLAVLAVRDRGVATSTTLRRRWFNGERWAHHLIDPRTGVPSTSAAVQVTVVAESALLADYHAKVALLLGVDGGLCYLESADAIEGLIVASGRVLTTSGLRDFVVQLESEGQSSGR